MKLHISVEFDESTKGGSLAKNAETYKLSEWIQDSVFDLKDADMPETKAQEEPQQHKI